MWPFSTEASQERLRGHKRITVNGMRFTIRKLNPLIDFPGEKVPQVFSAFVSRRAAGPAVTPATEAQQREGMYELIRAGVVEPKIVPEGSKEGVQASDLFRDPTLGTKLYIEIVAHSLNLFRGLKGVFFFHRTRLSLLTLWRNAMVKPLQKSPSQGAVSA